MSKTLVDLQEFVKDIAEQYKDRAAYRYLVDDIVVSKSYNDLAGDVFSLATWFKINGFARRHIAILGGTSYEWVVTFLAVACSNNIVIPLDKMLPKEDIYNLLKMGDVEAVFYSDEFANYFVDENRVKSQICFSDSRFQEMLKTTVEPLPEIDPKAMAELLFTSGTTGVSKGVMLTQENIMSNINEIYRLDFTSNLNTDNPIVLSVLPIHHTFELTVDNLGVLNCGATICINDKMENILANMQRFKPHVILVVPAIAEVFYKKLKEAMSKGKEKRLVAIAKTASKALDVMHIDARRSLYKKVIGRLGGNITNIVVGGAALRPEVANFFAEFGICMIQGYGLTECAPLVAANCPSVNRIGSVGKPVSFLETKLKDGEIIVKGPGVMLGYYKNEEATNEAIVDGWFHTGDLGRFDKDGFLYITGRSKNLIILDNGKNIYPEELEAKIKPIDGVKEVMVFADGGRLSALVVPTLAADRELRKTIEKGIQQMNETLPTYQKIVNIMYSNLELPKTTTLKIKRKEVMKRIEEQKRKKSVKYVAPQTPEQKRIIDAFEDVLGKKNISIMDDFFEQGGDSLSAFEAAALIGIQAQDIYEYSTAEKLERKLILNNQETDRAGDIDVNSLIQCNPNLEYNAKPKYILLTGATGFLGAHILWQLLRKKMNVVCLVRNEERLRSTLKGYFPGEYEFLNYKVVKGDIEKEHFGLNKEEYEILTNRVDMVIHTAANVQHAGHYSKFELTNVIGTQNVIDFCKDANAVLQYTSTASVSGAGTVSQTNPDAIFDENCLDIGQNYVQNVYIHSKYKAEERVLIAREQGLKANIFRIGNLTWRMSDGMFQKNAQDNGFIGRCKGLLKVKMYSSEMNEYPIDFTAVDECATAFVLLALHNRVNNIYHLYNPNVYSLENLTKKLLVHCKRVPRKVLEGRLREDIQDKEVAILSFYSSIATASKNITIRNEFTIQELEKLGFKWSKIDLRYLKYLKKLI